MLTENEIRRFIHQKESILSLPSYQLSYFYFPISSNFEQTVESDYLSLLSIAEKSQMQFKSKKKFADSSYEGDLLDEKRHGLGRMFYDSGRYYFGEWRFDLREGRGFEHYTSGNNYKGGFSKGKAHGVGMMRWASGEIYEGEWQEGLKHGKGICRSADGEAYIGHWKQGKAEGWGRQVLASKDTYEGHWQEGSKHGVGNETFCGRTEKYFGEYQNGKFSGFGIYDFKDGKRYKGMWKNGIQEGLGILQEKEKEIIGEFRSGEIDGIGYIRWKRGERYFGEIKKGVRMGKGEMTWIDGRVYIGGWENDKQTGAGVLINNDEGIMELGVFNDNALLEPCV